MKSASALGGSEATDSEAGSALASSSGAGPGAAVPMFASRLDQAGHIIRRNAGWAFGGGILPIPVVDMMVVSGFQLKMLNELSKLYGVPFSANAAKNIVSALLGSLLPSGFAHGATGYVLRSVPVVGPLLGALVMPAFSSAATWAIGRVFVQHFESGGTFLDFDPVKVREYFKAEFDRAQVEAKGKATAAA
jgi:uncharacterized protein (DUF697 family)